MVVGALLVVEGGGFFELDGQQVVGAAAAVDDDVGEDAAGGIGIVCGRVGPGDTLGIEAVAVVFDVDVPAAEGGLQGLGEFVGDGALAEVVLQQVDVVGVEDGQGSVDALPGGGTGGKGDGHGAAASVVVGRGRWETSRRPEMRRGRSRSRVCRRFSVFLPSVWIMSNMDRTWFRNKF